MTKNKRRAQFDIDLKRGEVGEELVKHIFCEKNVKIEVKTDFKVGDTGNICVECKCNDNFSGIAISTADYWTFVCGGKYNKDLIITVKTERLKKIALEYVRRKKFKMGGDNNLSKCILIPIKDLVDVSNY